MENIKKLILSKLNKIITSFVHGKMDLDLLEDLELLSILDIATAKNLYSSITKCKD